MIAKFRRVMSRRRQPSEQPVQVVDLSTWNGHDDEALTTIARPDSLGAVPHRLPALDPEQADCRLLVTQLVADLHANGCLDSAHASVLDHWIDAQLPGWLLVVDQQAQSRARTTMQLLAVDTGNLHREAQELLVLQQQQMALEAAWRHWRDVVSGRAVGFPPATATRQDAAAAPVLPDLADYRPAGYLDPTGAQELAEAGDSAVGGPPWIVRPHEVDDSGETAA